jgi:hypothetical protein
MNTKAMPQNQRPPRGKVLKEAVAGKEREEALKTIQEMAIRAELRAKSLGLSEVELQKLLNEP